MTRPRKLSLPVVEEILGTKPTLANARRTLGGRATSAAGAGRIVAIGSKVGAVLFASDLEIDVVFDGGLVRRTVPTQCVHHAGDVPGALRALADDARVFASIHEGDAVRYESRGESLRGTLIEKCRYGALVAAADGRILAVGFRKLWPASTGDAS